MPRLPDLDSLGSRPVPQSRSAVVRSQTAGVVGEAISGFANQVTRAGQQQLEKQDRLSYASAKALIANEDIAARKALADDPDFGTAEARYTERMKAAQGAAFKIIASSSDRSLFEIDSKTDIERGLSAVSSMVHEKRVDKGRADLSATIDALSKNAIDAPDDATRQNIFGTVNELLTGAKDSGFISNVEMGTMARGFAATDAGNRIERSLASDDVDGARNLLEASKAAMPANTYSNYYAQIQSKMHVRQASSDFALATALPEIGPARPAVSPIIPGNLPETIRYKVKNADGSVSTVRTISIGTDKGEVLIPTVIGGKVVSDKEAIAHFNKTGENFGTFKSPADADSYAEYLHNKHAAELDGSNKTTPVTNGKAAIESLFPGIVVTSNHRGDSNPLTKANPNSWHNKSYAAVDVAPIKGMAFDQFLKQIEDAGYRVIESRDEVTNPSPHATGPHWHVVLGDGGPQQGPRRWDKNAVYANIDSLADKEGWSFERRERAKDYANSQIARDENLLARQTDDADRQAQEFILNKRDGFKDASMIPRNIWANMSTTARAQAMNVAQANSAPKEPQANGPEIMIAHAIMYSSPDKFRDMDLTPFAGKVTRGELDSLISEQARLRNPLSNQDVSPREKVASTINFRSKLDPALDRALDPQKQPQAYAKVATDMDAYLRSVTQGKRAPTDAELDAAFNRATMKVVVPGFFFDHERPRYQLKGGETYTVDIPDDVRQRIIQTYARENPGMSPNDTLVTQIYVRNKGKAGFWP